MNKMVSICHLADTFIEKNEKQSIDRFVIPFLPFASPVHIPGLSFSRFKPITALTPLLAAPPGQLSLTGLE